MIVAGDSGNETTDADQRKCKAADASDKDGEGLGNKALRWSAYIGAATFALAAIGAAFAVLGTKSTRQSSRARILVQLAGGPEGNGAEFEIRNLGPTAALLQSWAVMNAPSLTEEGLEDVWKEKPNAFRRTLEAGKPVPLPKPTHPADTEVLIVVEFQDVFGVVRHAWRCFRKRENGGYEEGEDGELPAPWWAD